MTDTTQNPETSYVKPAMAHQCAKHGCPMRGTIQTNHDAVCTFHYGVKHKDVPEVTRRINQLSFQTIYRLAVGFLTRVSNEPYVTDRQIAWLNGEGLSDDLMARLKEDNFVKYQEFRPPEWARTHNRCGTQIIAMLTRYATHHAEKQELLPNNAKTQAPPKWAETVESVKAGIKLIPGGHDGIFE